MSGSNLEHNLTIGAENVIVASGGSLVLEQSDCRFEISIELRGEWNAKRSLPKYPVDVKTIFVATGGVLAITGCDRGAFWHELTVDLKPGERKLPNDMEFLIKSGEVLYFSPTVFDRRQLEVMTVDEIGNRNETVLLIILKIKLTDIWC